MKATSASAESRKAFSVARGLDRSGGLSGCAGSWLSALAATTTSANGAAKRPSRRATARHDRPSAATRPRTRNVRLRALIRRNGKHRLLGTAGVRLGKQEQDRGER